MPYVILGGSGSEGGGLGDLVRKDAGECSPERRGLFAFYPLAGRQALKKGGLRRAAPLLQPLLNPPGDLQSVEIPNPAENEPQWITGAVIDLA